MQNHNLIFKIDKHARAAEDGSYPVTISSEYPVQRSGYKEVLVHTAQSIDLSRAPLPLIEQHDVTRLNIGVVEKLHVRGKKLAGYLRLGESARGKELRGDIDSGIVSSISISYEWLKTEDRGDKKYITLWRPHEASLVSVPADPTVGINRTCNTQSTSKTLHIRSTTMSKNMEQDLIKAERNRVAQINAIAAKEPTGELSDVAARAIADGETVEEFQRYALHALMSRSDPRMTPSTYTAGPRANHGIDERDLARFSIRKAVLAACGDRDADAGFELEVSKHLAKSAHKQTRGVLIPNEVFTRAIVASGGGGSLIGTDHMAGQHIDALRDVSVVIRAGATQVPGLIGDVSIPRQVTAGSVSWGLYDNSSTVAESNLTLDQVTLSLKTVAGLQTFSHKMLKQSSPMIDSLIQQDLLLQVARAIDNAALEGTGLNNIPTGIVSQVGVNTQTVAAAGNPTWAEAVGFESACATDNALMGQLAYITTAAVAGKLKTTAKDTGSGIFLMEDGMLNGYPVYVTNHLAANRIVFGNFADLLIGQWGSFEILADPYGSNFALGNVSVRIFADTDIAVRHAQSFCINS